MNKERRSLVKIIAAAAGGAALTPLFAKNIIAAKESDKIPEVPWVYKKLDPVAVAERAYPGYYKGGCCYGVFEGIIGQLKEGIAYPYILIPTEMFIFGEGGVAGISSLCGALNGAAAAMFLVTGAVERKKREEAFEMIRELFNWYEQEALPNYRPKNPKYEIKGSISKSPLCHVSVTKWCKATGFKSFSKERDERCGWVTASTAKYAIELLNKRADMALRLTHPLSSEVKSCRSCHDKGGELENSRTTMDCGGCHFTGLRPKHP
jgi:hypothetical protein